MKKARPKKLYRFDIHHKLARFSVIPDTDFVETIQYDHGTLYRIQDTRKDAYGYATIKEAKAEEIKNLTRDIAELTTMLKKLRRL